MAHTVNQQRFRLNVLIAIWCGLLLAPHTSLADFTGPLITFNTNGGWSWFSDPRATIDNEELIIGSIAGVTGNGSSAGDVDVTTYDFATQATNKTLLHAALTQDDHADPAFAALPDGRVLVTYQAHGTDNFVHWRVGTFSGPTLTWGAEQTSTVNIANDGNGNTYSNPFYLRTPNEVVSFSRAIGYDPNYSVFSNLANPTPTFAYGGHWMYWKNPNNQTLTGGNGRPYVKYASNGTNTVWFATTEDSPQNYPNSLYSGYLQFNAAGAGTVFTSTGTSLGGLSTGTAPTGSANPPAAGNSGSIVSGTGNSYLPTQFTPIVKANQNFNGVNLTGKYVGWATSMQLDSGGNPYLGFVVVDNLNGAYGNDLEYYYAHFTGAAWQVSRVGYAGLPLYNGQNQYAGLMAVDPLDPNKIFLSADVNPATDAALLGPDGLQHWQIFEGTSSNNGATWGFTQLTDTASDNIRPLIEAGSGEEALIWMRGTYSAYTNFNTSVVGLVQTDPQYLPGDINRDGKVTVADVSALMTAISDLNAYQAANPDLANNPQLLLQVLDVNGDGNIDNTDIQALIDLAANNASGGGGGQLTAVPEPATLSLCGMGFSVLAVLRIRRCMAR